MARDYKPDTFKLQELVSKGIPMKKREEVSPPSSQDVEPVSRNEEVAESPKPVERAKRKTAPKGDYESLFITKNDLNERKTIYIAKKLQDKLEDIVMSMKNRDMTIGIYVENIILHHFEVYKDDINSLSEIKFKKPL